MQINNTQDQEIIICAAIWYKDYPKAAHPVSNVGAGVVVGGRRHGDIISTMYNITGKSNHKLGSSVQGFLTSKNRFLDRKEAHALFVSNGGNPEFKNELYSEDLY